MAEKSVLGCLLLDGKFLDDVSDIIRPEDFYLDACRRIYLRMLAMDAASSKIDLKLLIDALRSAGEFETVGGYAALEDILDQVAIPQHAAYYARIVARKAKYRRLISAGTGLLRDAYAEAGEPEEILDAAEHELTAIGTETSEREPVEMAVAVQECLRRADAIADRKTTAGLFTGLSTFDENIGGLFCGELFILAARPGVGKTSLACQIAENFGLHERRVLFISLEMSACELATRMVAGHAGVSSRKLRSADMEAADFEAMAASGQELAPATISIYDHSTATVFDIRRRARRLARNGLALIVVDYLQRVTPIDSKASRYEQVGQMTRGLKSLARELNIPVLCLAQLGRDADKDTEPRLSHLRESGDIEADADVVAFLAVEKPTGQGTPSEMAFEERRAKLSVVKNRNGETGDFELAWVPYRTRFFDRPAVCEFGC